MVEEITNWKKFREFRAVDLAQSFVLSWDMDFDSLLIDLDLFLCPDHAFFEAPRPAEQACFRPAVMEFPSCSSMILDEAGDALSLSDAIASLSHGRIDDLILIGDGHYEITGEFGRVEIVSERLILRMKDTAT